jgi:hypothetical protein
VKLIVNIDSHGRFFLDDVQYGAGDFLEEMVRVSVLMLCNLDKI